MRWGVNKTKSETYLGVLGREGDYNGWVSLEDTHWLWEYLLDDLAL